MQLTRKSIEGKDEEVIFEDISKDNLEVYRLRGTSQYLYFEAMATSSENSEEYEGGLYRCDLSSGESTLMVKNLVGPYSIAGEQVYYTNESGLCCYSIQKQTTDIIVNQPMEIQKITLTENYMIVCDGDADNRLVIYDYDGNEMATVEGDSSLTNYYGGNNNLLFGLRVDEYSMSWCTLDLSNINNGLQWKSL
jgi:hypothetical protein